MFYRNYWRFLIFNIFPIYPLEKRMIFNLFTAVISKPFLKIFIQQLKNKVISLWTHHTLLTANLWPLNFALNDISKNFFNCEGWKWAATNQQLVGHYPQTPPIDAVIVVRGLVDNLRSYIIWSANNFSWIRSVYQCSSPIILLLHISFCYIN